MTLVGYSHTLLRPYDRKLIQHYFLCTVRPLATAYGGDIDVFRSFSNHIVTLLKPTKEYFMKEHILKSKPAILKYYCENWQASQLWNDDQYLLQSVGDAEIDTEVSSSMSFTGEEDQNTYQVPMRFSKFLEEYMKPDRKTNYYLAETDIKLVGNLAKDVPEIPSFFEVSCILRVLELLIILNLGRIFES